MITVVGLLGAQTSMPSWTAGSVAATRHGFLTAAWNAPEVERSLGVRTAENGVAE